MQPSEQFVSKAEKLPLEEEVTPQFDPNAEYNGMYRSPEEFEAARDAYSINTINLDGNDNYPLATTAETATWQSEDPNEAEALPSVSVETETVPTKDDEIIDVEAKVVKNESLDDDVNLAEFIDQNDELEDEGEKMPLTPKLKQLAKNTLSYLDHILTDDSVELPEEIDWRSYIATEPEYDGSYDYIVLQRILNKEYQRRRLKKLSGKNLADAVSERIFGQASPPPPPESPTAETAFGEAEGEPNGAKVETGENGTEPLKIEMDKPNQETPALEYQGEAPALTYEQPPTPNQGQAGQKQITQQ